MDKLIIWLIIVIFIYLMYLLFVIMRKKKMKNIKNNTYINYLVRVYKLNIDKLNLKKLIHVIALSNAIIIATTFIIILNIENFILMMVLAFITLIPLQMLVYHIIGKMLKRREENV